MVLIHFLIKTTINYINQHQSISLSLPIPFTPIYNHKPLKSTPTYFKKNNKNTEKKFGL